MIYIYRNAASNGALELARALEGRKVRLVPSLGRGDVLVCWGETAPTSIPRGVRVLNGGPIRNKMEDALTLQRAGVPTVAVSATRPPQIVQQPASLTLPDRFRGVSILSRDQATALAGEIREFLARPVARPDTAIWLPRRFNHVGGMDLLRPPTTPDFFARKEELVEEYRVHCFNGLSIRAGHKVAREGARPHAWIRSFDGGWSISYDGFSSRREHRELAAASVAALGLDFGAVDIGRKRDNSLLVLEVNRAPGLEGNTIAAYAQAIENWMEGGNVASQGPEGSARTAQPARPRR